MHSFSLGPIQPKKESFVKILRRTVIPLYYNLQSKGISMKMSNFKTKGLSRGWNCLARYQFLESPSSFSGPKNCFMFTVFALKIKVSIILKMIQ